MRVSSLPAFPWDGLAPITEQARRHELGLVDLSVGTPVDPTPELEQEVLRNASNSPGYPNTAGTPQLRRAVLDWFARARGVEPHAAGLSEDAVLPALGLKELVAFLPSYLELGPEDVVMYPRISYPTYDVGARLAGAQRIASDAVTAPGPGKVDLVWLNSPGNPTGKVLGIEHLAKVVNWARERGAIVVSDECYAELAWREPWASSGVPSVLDPRVTGGSTEGVLALYSLSKRSNLAGYRAAFAAGDSEVISRLLEVRKHAGMIMPGPVQAVLTALLGDDSHVEQQRARYRKRRETLLPALERAGFRIDDSEAGLYLWATHPRLVAEAPTNQPAAWHLLSWFADHGILVAPGTFYGPAGGEHVRVALTASDSQISAAAQRLTDADS